MRFTLHETLPPPESLDTKEFIEAILEELREAYTTIDELETCIKRIEIVIDNVRKPF